MNLQSKTNLHTFYRLNQNDRKQLVSNKITMSYAKKFKTQSIQPSHKLNFNKNDLEKQKTNFKLAQTNLLKKHKIVKPIKYAIQQTLLTLKQQNYQNQSVNEKKEELYPNLDLKRNFCTAPFRKRLKSQANKQNLINQEQNNHHELKQEEKSKLQSISSIFHSNSKQNLAKLSYLMKYRNKPHMIFCASKLPKDFFGESVETPSKFHKKFLTLNRNQQQNFQNLKASSSVKILTKKTSFQNINLLNFNNKNVNFKSDTNKNETAYTFRKRQSKKQIQKNQQAIITPNFENKFQNSIILNQSDINRTNQVIQERFKQASLHINTHSHPNQSIKKIGKHNSKVNLKL